MSLEKEMVFFNALTGDMSPEEIMLESQQTMIAAEISIKRQQLGLSQKQLAEKMGVTQALVSRWEAGAVNFRLSTLVKIASALGLKMQLPFFPSPSIHYGNNSAVFYSMPNSNSWESNVYQTSQSTTYHTENGVELKEN